MAAWVRRWRYLAAAGVGELHLADFDTVDLTNLQRQVIHDNGASVGVGKVESAMRRLGALNPQIRLVSHSAALDEDSLDAAVAAVDLVLDCTDNFATRGGQRRLRARRQAAGQRRGDPSRGLSVFDTRRDESPCYHCLYGHGSEAELTCSEAGGSVRWWAWSVACRRWRRLLWPVSANRWWAACCWWTPSARASANWRVRRDPSCASAGNAMAVESARGRRFRFRGRRVQRIA